VTLPAGWRLHCSRQLESDRASGEHLMPRLGRQQLEPYADHLRPPPSTGSTEIGQHHLHRVQMRRSAGSETLTPDDQGVHLQGFFSTERIWTIMLVIAAF
jgi:hypothetical protein